ncbi:hypothetical protein FRC02_009643 [Tulasnella sp. 418]|nr:hypothetical protein FRC02_009643 [Tulasnella sp. 418]
MRALQADEEPTTHPEKKKLEHQSPAQVCRLQNTLDMGHLADETSRATIICGHPKAQPGGGPISVVSSAAPHVHPLRFMTIPPSSSSICPPSHQTYLHRSTDPPLLALLSLAPPRPGQHLHHVNSPPSMGRPR